ncbi:MAG: bifunctional oligoribonuclease/PAP phosphatase NrnA [bacterium]|nr:bifunctional oligoribonuclease/PAP phosphatase NrnA [bacterium]
MEIIEKIINLIKKYDNFLLVIHENPDGDTVATSLALQIALRKLGKSVESVCKDDIPKPFAFLPLANTVRKDFLVGDYDAIIVLDCGDLRRTGFPQRLKEFAKHKKNLINIDHHPKNDLHKIASINLIDENAAAVSEIVFNLTRLLHIELDKDMATCFLTSLYTDTGGFKHPNTTPRSLEYAATWLAHGARLKLITKNISLNRTVSSLKLWGIALSRIHKNSFGFVTTVVTRRDMEKAGASDNDLSGVVNMINSIPGSMIALLLSETSDGKIKASLRTDSDEIDVSKIAHLFGGGGHRRASGFTIPGRLKQNIRGGWNIIQTDH